MKRLDVIKVFCSDVWAHLHEVAGVCTHCGKRKCPLRANGSTVTRAIHPDELLAAMTAAAKRRRP